MVIGYHVIFSAYGFWLPNDPRGSWSWVVRAPELREFGPATKVDTHRSAAHRPHDRSCRLAAKAALDLAPVRFDGRQAPAIATGFADYSRKSGVSYWGLAVMPDHTHAVVARHTYEVEQIANLMKGAATQLLCEGRHPFGERRNARGDVPACFARKWWVVFLHTEDDVTRTVDYVRRNPLRAGLPEQRWPFVARYPERVIRAGNRPG